MKIKETNVTITAWSVIVSSHITSGTFSMTFTGETARERRYRIHITMKLYYIGLLSQKILGIRKDMQDFVDRQFRAFKD